MVVSILTFSASAALPEATVQPLWNNSFDVTLAHDALGTTAHCYVDITLYSGATMQNAVVRLIAMSESLQRIVKEWTTPVFTVEANNIHSFYETVSDIVLGNIYQLVF